MGSSLCMWDLSWAHEEATAWASASVCVCVLESSVGMGLDVAGSLEREG